MRLIIVSNRLPVSLEKDDGGNWKAKPSSGGLVTALAPLLKDRGGLWIGWPGNSDVPEAELEKAVADAGDLLGINLAQVYLSREEEDNYYAGFSNEILWPLFHDMAGRCNFNPNYWDYYQQVNRKFADKILEHIKPQDYVWIHDYHLMLAGQELRDKGLEDRIGFFLHNPFPSPDIFLQLPWGFEILKGLLAFNLVGLQTHAGPAQFCAMRAQAHDGNPSGRQRPDSDVAVQQPRGAGRRFSDRHRLPRISPLPPPSGPVAEKAWYIHEKMPGRQIVLGIDRLDYTKGIPERLKAFNYALTEYPELRGRIVMIQVVVPSRRTIPEYEDLKAEIEGLVGQINGRFSRFDWIPVLYFFPQSGP